MDSVWEPWLGGLPGRLYGDDRPEGCITNIVIGIAGALLGGAIYSVRLLTDWTAKFNLPSLIVAILGSLLLIFVLRRLGRAGYRAEIAPVAMLYSVAVLGCIMSRCAMYLCPFLDSGLGPAFRGRFVLLPLEPQRLGGPLN